MIDLIIRAVVAVVGVLPDAQTQAYILQGLAAWSVLKPVFSWIVSKTSTNVDDTILGKLDQLFSLLPVVKSDVKKA